MVKSDDIVKKSTENTNLTDAQISSDENSKKNGTLAIAPKNNTDGKLLFFEITTIVLLIALSFFVAEEIFSAMQRRGNFCLSNDGYSMMRRFYR